MARIRWMVCSVVIAMLVTSFLLVNGCAQLGKSSEQVFTPTQSTPAQTEPSMTVPGYWAGVVPWESDEGVVNVVTTAQSELYPGDGKFTQSVADIPFINPPLNDRAVSNLADGGGYYYAENVSPSEVQGLTFDPSGEPAFACYELALSANSPMTIGIAWYSMPTNFDRYYIGIGDTSSNVWHWYMGPDDGVLTFDPAEWDGKVSGSVLVCVALQDGLLADFWKLRAGVSEVRGTGLEYEEVPADKVLSSVEVSAQASLPSSVDLTTQIHGIRNQGSMGSCTAFACTDASLSILLNQVYSADGWDTSDDELKPSPMWAYVKSGIPPIGNWNPVCGSSVGRYMSQAFDVLEEIGAATDFTVPYYATSNCSTTFTARADTEASLIQINDWYSLGGSDLAESVKIQLATYHRPVVIAMYRLEYTFLNYTGGVYEFNPTGAAVNGGHAMCIVGYDDGLQAFNVRNSWGTSWGLSGYWWCSYDSVNAMASAGRLSAYIEELEYNQDAASHFLGVAPITIDEIEPNDYPNMANTLPAFPVVGYAGALGDGDGADCFSFKYRAGYATDFTAEVSGSLLLKLELYTESGQLIYSPSEEEPQESISGQWLVNGKAILKVQWLNGKGFYTLDAEERRPPPVPENLVASDGTSTNMISLAWHASQGATSYRIERSINNDGPYEEIGATYSVSYDDDDVEPWSYYYYRVRAINDGGASIPSEVEKGYLEVPSPTNVRAGDGNMSDKVRITWEGMSGGLEYTVRRSMFREGPYEIIGETSNWFFEDMETDLDVPYYYTVSAGLGDFDGPPSEPETGYRHKLQVVPNVNQEIVIPNQSGSIDEIETQNPGDDRVNVGNDPDDPITPVKPEH